MKIQFDISTSSIELVANGTNGPVPTLWGPTGEAGKEADRDLDAVHVHVLERPGTLGRRDRL